MNSVALYTITVAIWGSTWLAIRYQLGTVAPELSIAYRLVLASAILFAYSAVKRLPLRFSRKAHLSFGAQALFLYSLNYLAIYLAEAYLPSGLVAIVFSTIIFLNVVFGSVILRLKVRPYVLYGGLLGMAGLALVFLPQLQSSDLSGGARTGLLLALTGTILASLGNITSARNQKRGLPVVQTNAYGMLYGALIMIVVSSLRGASLEFDTSPSYLLSLAYLALFSSVIGFGAYLTLLGRIGSDRAAYVTVLFPMVALALSTWLEGLSWSFPQIVGVGLALFGNLFALGRIRELRIRRQWKAASAAD
ncbi:MAG: DMT family transporter [Anaerolineales bacterium]